MAFVFDTTPPGIPSDAYCDLVEAEAFALRVADMAAWTAADEDGRGRALLQASDEIDTLAFAGVPHGDWLAGRDGAQARAFPRFVADEPAAWPAGKRVETGAVWDTDAAGAAVVPERVKFATFLQALTILRDPARVARLRDRFDGVASQAAGGFSEAYDPARPVSLVCLEARRLLARYALRGGRVVG